MKRVIKRSKRGPLYWMIVRDGKRVYEHRAVMEGMLNRKLLRREVVHHRDGNGLNNHPDNLELVSHAEHMRIHLGLNGRWSTRHTSCVCCGKTKFRHLSRGLCTSCYQKEEYRRDKERVDRNHKRYRERHKEEVAERIKRYNEQNHESRLAYFREYNRTRRKR